MRLGGENCERFEMSDGFEGEVCGRGVGCRVCFAAVSRLKIRDNLREEKA